MSVLTASLERTRRADVVFSQSRTPRELAALIEQYRAVRAATDMLCEPLVPEDYVVQSMPDASPTKWHLAHTTWFFESFVLREHLPAYKPVLPQYAYLFNSYYNAVGPMHCRDRRGLISRPTVAETRHYRAQVDQQVIELLSRYAGDKADEISALVTLGLNHEQQHQELLLTDLKHMFGQNPLYPVYKTPAPAGDTIAPPLRWVRYPEGLYEVGHAGNGFAYDNEGPRHRQYVHAFALASRPVTNGEFLAFVEDGGYRTPQHWLSLGWQAVQLGGWKAPLYWECRERRWHHFTLGGFRLLDESEPVAHLSYFEANAYARWAGCRLPTEAEWEVAAPSTVEKGNFVESGAYHPQAAVETSGAAGLAQMYGDVWEWTQSAYLPYRGYEAAQGAIGEYNGKFMCGQMVLRGGSCATPQSHIRRTYRNFFAPDKRWQFSGVRLAKDSA